MLPLPKPPKIIKKGKNIATFEIEALYPGYGVTIGNSLRRVLYSSLPGAAITQVKIKGIQHEFSTIPYVLEDVLNICLNLKQLRFKMFTDTPQIGKLQVKGEKEIKAKDLKLPTQVEVVNKDAHIATLTDKKAELEMEIQIEKGLGYEPIERRKGGSKTRLEIGQIPLDAIFTPIKRVKYSIENMRVGERTDFDRLILEIETDGTILPEEAFLRASQILIDHFSLLSESLKEKRLKIPEEKVKKEKEVKAKEDVTSLKVEDLKLSNRTLNALLRNNIKTVGGILRKKEEGLQELEGLGEKGIQEIKETLKKLKVELK